MAPAREVDLTCGILVTIPLRLNFPCDSADDTKLREESDSLGALKLRGGTGKVVDAAQADLGLLGLQDHDVALDDGHRKAGVLVGAPAKRLPKDWGPVSAEGGRGVYPEEKCSATQLLRPPPEDRTRLSRSTYCKPLVSQLCLVRPAVHLGQCS